MRFKNSIESLDLKEILAWYLDFLGSRLSRLISVFAWKRKKAIRE